MYDDIIIYREKLNDQFAPPKKLEFLFTKKHNACTPRERRKIKFVKQHALTIETYNVYLQENINMKAMNIFF